VTSPSKAFVLGAGLGTRLRPLTEGLPKPLVPVWNRPLLCYAFDHLLEELGVGEFLVNTHHRPEAYDAAFPSRAYRGAPLSFRHEPVLLDTGGGLDNLRDWLPENESFAVCNGDVLTDLPLRAAWERHLAEDNAATLVLRSRGEELRVGYDEASGRVVDLRGLLRPEWEDRRQFTGIYFLAPRFLRYLVPGRIESVVLALVRAIEAGERVGGAVVDEGIWSDLGDRESYLAASAALAGFRRSVGPRIAPEAVIAASARIDCESSVGSGAVVGEGAVLERSVLWAGAEAAPGARLRGVVVRGGRRAEGELAGVDL